MIICVIYKPGGVAKCMKKNIMYIIMYRIDHYLDRLLYVIYKPGDADVR